MFVEARAKAASIWSRSERSRNRSRKPKSEPKAQTKFELRAWRVLETGANAVTHTHTHAGRQAGTHTHTHIDTLTLTPTKQRASLSRYVQNFSLICRERMGAKAFFTQKSSTGLSHSHTGKLICMCVCLYLTSIFGNRMRVTTTPRVPLCAGVARCVCGNALRTWTCQCKWICMQPGNVVVTSLNK